MFCSKEAYYKAIEAATDKVYMGCVCKSCGKIWRGRGRRKMLAEEREQTWKRRRQGVQRKEGGKAAAEQRREEGQGHNAMLHDATRQGMQQALPNLSLSRPPSPLHLISK